MKENKKTARNYAQALMELTGGDVNLQDTFLDEIKNINQLMSKDEPIRKIFENPGISKDEKKKIVETLKHNISAKIFNFLCVLIDKQRFNILSEIQDELNKLVNKAKGIVIAEVYSSQEIEESMVKTIVETLRRSVSTKDVKDIKVEQKIDHSLIGGLKVKINDLVFDGSIKGRLENIKRRLG